MPWPYSVYIKCRSPCTYLLPQSSLDWGESCELLTFLFESCCFFLTSWFPWYMDNQLLKSWATNEDGMVIAHDWALHHPMSLTKLQSLRHLHATIEKISKLSSIHVTAVSLTVTLYTGICRLQSSFHTSHSSGAWAPLSPACCLNIFCQSLCIQFSQGHYSIKSQAPS